VRIEPPLLFEMTFWSFYLGPSSTSSAGSHLLTGPSPLAALRRT
jgi:hypothetical protein